MTLPNSSLLLSMQKAFEFRKLICSAYDIPKTKTWEGHLTSGADRKKAREGLLVVGVFAITGLGFFL